MDIEKYKQIKKYFPSYAEVPNNRYLLIEHILKYGNIDEIKSLFTDFGFDECKKVLKKNGLMIHVVPSTAWSIGTNFWHYILLPKFFMKLRRSNFLSVDTNNADKNIKKKKKMVKKIINVLFLHPLGTNPSFIHEFYYFSKYRWRKLFQNQGFKVINVENGPYFYSGHSILKNKLLVIRKMLAKSGFTGSFCFVLKK